MKEAIEKKPKKSIAQRIINRLRPESTILPLKETMLWQIEKCKKTNISWKNDLKTVGILLGPYRKYFQLDYDKQWLKDSLKCLKLKKTYQYQDKWVKAYKLLIRHYFKNKPRTLENLKQML